VIVVYAIVDNGGKQYKVSVDQIIKVDKLDLEVGDEYKLTKVLLVANEDNILINGNENELAHAYVTASVISHGKGKKLIIYKYKAKKGFHKKKGYRQKFTELKINSICV
jgi:large subunit ribosomal protein L21